MGIGWRKKIPKGIRTDLRLRILEHLLPFLRGEISQSDFDDRFDETWQGENWNPFDQALDSVCDLIFLCYTDWSSFTIWVEPDTFEFLKRSVAWLQTDLPWDPPIRRTWSWLIPLDIPAVTFHDGCSPFESVELWEANRHRLEGLLLPQMPPPVRKILGPGESDEDFRLKRGKSFRLWR